MGGRISPAPPIARENRRAPRRLSHGARTAAAGHRASRSGSLSGTLLLRSVWKIPVDLGRSRPLKNQSFQTRSGCVEKVLYFHTTVWYPLAINREATP